MGEICRSVENVKDFEEILLEENDLFKEEDIGFEDLESEG